jgi:hypothetical protein
MKQDPAETALFARLAQDQRFREWLEARLADEFEILVAGLDKDFLARAQGRAGFLQLLLKKLEAARKAA